MYITTFPFNFIYRIKIFFFLFLLSILKGWKKSFEFYAMHTNSSHKIRIHFIYIEMRPWHLPVLSSRYSFYVHNKSMQFYNVPNAFTTNLLILIVKCLP